MADVLKRERDFQNGFSVVYNSDVSCGIIDKTGKPVTKMIYSDIRPFVNGYAAVKRDNLWGFVNTDGVEVIPCKYYYAVI